MLSVTGHIMYNLKEGLFKLGKLKQIRVINKIIFETGFELRPKNSVVLRVYHFNSRGYRIYR